MGQPINEINGRSFLALAVDCLWDRTFPGTRWVWEALEQLYTEPGRHYHGLAHIRHCLQEAYSVQPPFDDTRPIKAAIFFHDAIYDPTRHDNEEQSADLAARYLREMDFPSDFIDRVRALILDTRHAAPPTTIYGQYLADIDLSILGQSPETFDAYERAIRLEYAHVPDAAFRAGRAAILRNFLNRPTIYHTEHFRQRYEAKARENLERSLQSLSADTQGNPEGSGAGEA